MQSIAKLGGRELRAVRLLGNSAGSSRLLLMPEGSSNDLPVLSTDEEELMESHERAPRSVCAVGTASLLLLACLFVPKNAQMLFGFNSGMTSLQDGNNHIKKPSTRNPTPKILKPS